MASTKQLLHLMVVVSFILLIYCVYESDGRRGGYRGGSRYRSGTRYRSGVRYHSSRVRVRQRVRNTYISNRVRRGSSPFSSSTWKAAVIAGSIYGGTRYMRSSYYHRYPDRMPPICTNNFEKAPNGRIYGHFICPRESEPANYTWCCGANNNEFCCDERYYDRRRASGGSDGTSPFAIIAVVVVIIIIIVIIIVCVMKKRRNQGLVLDRKNHQQGVPLRQQEVPGDARGDMKADFPAMPQNWMPPAPHPPAPGPYPTDPPTGPYLEPGAYPAPVIPYASPPGPGPYPEGSAPPYPPGPMPPPYSNACMPPAMPPQGICQPTPYPVYPPQ